MTPESLAAALDTMPEQRQAIADGMATTETYEAVAQRVAVFEALNKSCTQLAEIGEEDWVVMQQHVLTCALCKPADPKRLRERVEYLAPGLVAVPEDEERRWLAFFQSPVRSVSDVVTKPVKALTDLITKNGPVLADPHVWKAAAAVVGFVVFLLAMPSSERVEPPPSRHEAQKITEPAQTLLEATPPLVAGPSVSTVPPTTEAPTPGPVVSTAPKATTAGTTNAQQPGGSTEDRKRAAAPTGWAYASTPYFAYDQPVGQQVELHRQWQWGTWRRNGVERYLSLVRKGEGAYEVRLPELGGTSGTVHTALSNGWGYPQAFSCQTEATRSDGRDLLADVACFNPNGTRKNLPFAIVFVSDGPAVAYRGGAPGVARTGTGQYEVTTLGGNGFAMVSPVGSARATCRSAVEATRVRVSCDTDTSWNLTYTENAAIHHDPSAMAAYLTTGINRSWSSNGETPSVTRTGTGQYDVRYQGIGNPKVYPADAVLVSASGPEPRYCRIWAWNGYSYPPGVLVQIRCYDQAGAAADSSFALAYVRSP
ncbi:hypothetical protein C8D87_10364 [Lentzea atacamensis]|uniref:Zinc-finger domain-containing protein n=1 Tax=Lentzea atacamensis TaxID=531938 RepID=A0ABX9E998_9PSEU|nr:hypothetical protein [Lentzea atacamensis]RAS66725.1 hypothetical protein C8D87_10364 [Lentzea atacamensis]